VHSMLIFVTGNGRGNCRRGGFAIRRLDRRLHAERDCPLERPSQGTRADGRSCRVISLRRVLRRPDADDDLDALGQAAPQALNESESPSPQNFMIVTSDGIRSKSHG
jgi:hypothetical protein